MSKMTQYNFKLLSFKCASIGISLSLSIVDVIEDLSSSMPLNLAIKSSRKLGH
jgi:hypothetical protein